MKSHAHNSASSNIHAGEPFAEAGERAATPPGRPACPGLPSAAAQSCWPCEAHLQAQHPCLHAAIACPATLGRREGRQGGCWAQNSCQIMMPQPDCAAGRAASRRVTVARCCCHLPHTHTAPDTQQHHPTSYLMQLQPWQAQVEVLKPHSQVSTWPCTPRPASRYASALSGVPCPQPPASPPPPQFSSCVHLQHTSLHK